STCCRNAPSGLAGAGLRSSSLRGSAPALVDDLVGGLQVDEHVGALDPRADLVLELVRDLVRALERRAGGELHVQIDVPRAPGAASAQLVEAGDLPGRMARDRRPDRIELVGRERLVDEHTRR